MCWESYGASGAWAWDWTLVETPRAASAVTEQVGRSRKDGIKSFRSINHPLIYPPDPSITKRQATLPYCVLQRTRPHPGGAPEEADSAAAAAAAEQEEEELQLEEQPDDNDDDDACLLPVPHRPSSDVDWEFHIVYSDVFRVPSLWLAAAWPDGRPLTEAELAGALPTPPDVAFTEDDGQVHVDGPERQRNETTRQPRQVVERWTMLSQDEHPVLGRPFCCLHPCGTAARMRHLLPPPETPDAGTPTAAMDGGGNADDDGAVHGAAYLIKWFGLVAPVVGLPYPAAFAQRALLQPASGDAGAGGAHDVGPGQKITD